MIITKQHETVVVARHSQTNDQVRVLLVVEGTNDIKFLHRISRVLHAHDPSLPDLGNMEDRGELIFIPFGGGHVAAWTDRLAPLGVPEFHLYDRELPPETDHRREAAKSINLRERCQAALTRKRSLENYLHPLAITSAGEIDLMFEDFDPVAEITAKAFYQRGVDETPWECLSRRARSRMTHRAKRWLNTTAADRMTIELLQERDPEGEVMSWIRAIGRLAETS